MLYKLAASNNAWLAVIFLAIQVFVSARQLLVVIIHKPNFLAANQLQYQLSSQNFECDYLQQFNLISLKSPAYSCQDKSILSN